MIVDWSVSAVNDLSWLSLIRHIYDVRRALPPKRNIFVIPRISTLLNSSVCYDSTLLTFFINVACHRSANVVNVVWCAVAAALLQRWPAVNVKVNGKTEMIGSCKSVEKDLKRTWGHTSCTSQVVTDFLLIFPNFCYRISRDRMSILL